MGSEKIFFAIVIVFLLITISQNRIKTKVESMYAANWTGQPGADSVTRAAPLLVRVR